MVDRVTQMFPRRICLALDEYSHQPWAVEWFEETQLAEPTGEYRTWLKDIKYAFDTGNIDNWEKSADPKSGIDRKEYPVYRVNMYKIKEGE